MPARVHAILVVRPDLRAPAAHRLERTLAALAAQTRRVDALTVAVCGADGAVSAAVAASGADRVLTLPRGTRFAQAVRRAVPLVDGDAVWLLAQDTVPEPEALQTLAGLLERAPSVAVAAPKLVRWDDPTRIVSLGVSVTRLGRTVELAAGEYDQGQHDDTADVLGADVRGLLVRRAAWDLVDGLDPALGGADEGLDLSVRARLADGRVSVAPHARVRVYGDGVAGLPGLPPRVPGRSWLLRRRAQLHRRLVYARGPVAALAWLTLLPLALWHTAAHLVMKTPGRIPAEWGAALAALLRLRAVARARARLHRAQTAPWSRIAPLRLSGVQLRTGLHVDAESVAPQRAELRFFSGGGAWAVLGACLVSVAVFGSLLTWPALGGGALAPLRSTVGRLWADAGYGLRPLGLHQIAPADPFSAVVAVLGTAWPADPSRAVVLLWLAALPLAVLGGWFAATRVTDRSVLRIAGGVLWALAPTFLVALGQGRPAAVLVHLLLPWLLFAAAAAHRSWGAAGAASLAFAAVAACAPSLAPALVLLWLVLLVGVGIAHRGAGTVRIGWLPVPALVLFAPVILHQLRAHNPWGLLADPGVPWAGPRLPAGAAGRALLAAGSPTADVAGWAGVLHGTVLAGLPAGWTLLLLAPLGVAAVLALFTRRWLTAAALLLVALAGLGTALLVVGVAVSVTGLSAVPLWPGAGLSLMWAGVAASALVAADTGPRRAPSPVVGAQLVAGRGRVAAATVLMATVAVFALPGLTAHVRGTALITDGPTSTLPAYVAAEGNGRDATGTAVVRPLPDGAIATTVVWGESQTLGGQSTIVATRPGLTADDIATAHLGAELVRTTASEVVRTLASDGIGFVLLAPADQDSDSATALRLSAAAALDQRGGLAAVGQTAAGTLWRVTVPVTPRPPASAAVRGTAGGVAAGQLLAVAIALLLAVPTAQSRRRAQHAPRVVGRMLTVGEGA